jgi:hypothetical protein
MEEPELLAERKPKVWHNVQIKGQWRLVYRVDNSQGVTAFGGYQLPVYSNPFTGEQTYLRDVDRRALTGYMIDRIVKVLNPDESENDRLLISWLICHPEVTVMNVKDLDPQILKKKISDKITLVNLDFEEADKIDEEDYIDKLVGLLSLDGGSKAVGLTKLRYIMAQAGLSYIEARYQDDSDAEKKALRSRLKSYARKSIENARAINDIMSKMNDAQDTYEFKEMVRLKVLEFVNGVYKIGGVPVGTSQETVTVFFTNHPEVKTEALTQLYRKIK